ncbi:MAG TPA: hypothetical protein VI670_03945 [Thermoanaerobaculia bacterium]|jgi:hypothetical protein
MKKLLVAIVVVAAVAFCFKKFAPGGDQPSTEGKLAGLFGRYGGSGAKAEVKARKRLDAFLEAWKAGGTTGNDAEQAAACLWARGVRFTGGEEFRDAMDSFDRFRRSKDLYGEIASYSVDGGPVHGNIEGRGAYNEFAVTINGAQHKIGVPEKENPLFWLD